MFMSAYFPVNLEQPVSGLRLTSSPTRVGITRLKFSYLSAYDSVYIYSHPSPSTISHNST